MVLNIFELDLRNSHGSSEPSWPRQVPGRVPAMDRNPVMRSSLRPTYGMQFSQPCVVSSLFLIMSQAFSTPQAKRLSPIPLAHGRVIHLQIHLARTILFDPRLIPTLKRVLDLLSPRSRHQDTSSASSEVSRRPLSPALLDLGRMDVVPLGPSLKKNVLILRALISFL